MTFKDYYQILGIESSATQNDIKKAFHKKAMEYHPDRNAGFKEEAEKKMKEINEAYDVLSDSEKRRIYDYEYDDSIWSTGESERKRKSSSSNNNQNRDKQNNSNDDKTIKENKVSIKIKFKDYIRKFWQWSVGKFKKLPIVIQFLILIAILWWFISAYEAIFPEDKPYQYTPSTSYTSQNTPIQSFTQKANSWTIDSMFAAYCGLNRLFILHSLAPDSKYYKRLMENNSDVSSQIAIAPKLIAERSLIGMDSFFSDARQSIWPFEHSISILEEADARMLRFLENMKYIKTVEDFKENMIADYAVSVNLLQWFSEAFMKDYQNYPNQSESNASMLIANGAMMCNGNADISFWDSWLSEVNATSEELWSRRIMQDANFRETPWTNGRIIRPLIKGEYVTVLDKKKVNSMDWYEVEQFYTKWWVSYLAFVDDPSKASASDCDPINGHIDENGYCECNDGYKWMGSIRSCVLKSTISGERILTEMEINIATCWLGWYISPYDNKCECDWKEWYWMWANGKCEKRL